MQLRMHELRVIELQKEELDIAALDDRVKAMITENGRLTTKLRDADKLTKELSNSLQVCPPIFERLCTRIPQRSMVTECVCDVRCLAYPLDTLHAPRSTLHAPRSTGDHIELSEPGQQ
jgi:hypothetical protein